MENKSEKQCQLITNQLIEQIELAQKTGASWTKPFEDIGTLPYNAVTGKTYNGINVLILGLLRKEQAWASYAQWQSIGAQVKAKEKGTKIVFFKPIVKEDKKTEKKEKFAIRKFYSVFSSAQVDGYEEPSIEPEKLPSKFEVMNQVENYVKQTQARIERSNSGAWYRPKDDFIGMPDKSSFFATSTSTIEETYYSTLLHELTHWTGHKSRLNRLELKNNMGYAFEELVAEIGATFQCVKLKVSNQPREDHAQYLASWLKALKDDNKLIFKAAAAAQKAVDYLDTLQENKGAA